MGAGSKEVATIEALPDKVNGTTPTKNKFAPSPFGRVLKVLKLKILNKSHDVIKYWKGKTYPALHTTKCPNKKSNYLPIPRFC